MPIAAFLCTALASLSQKIDSGIWWAPGVVGAVAVYYGYNLATELFTGFGRKGKSAEVVAEELAREVRGYLASDAPVGEHLADKLLIPLALAGAGSFVATPLSSHATTNMDVIREFLPRKFRVDRSRETVHRVDVE